MAFQSEIQSKQVFSSVDRAIIEETNRELQSLQQDMQDLQETQLLISKHLGEQAEPLNDCEIKVNQAFENTIQGTKKIEESHKLVGDRFRFISFVSGGGTIGGLLGAIGFVANPIVGSVAVLTGVVVGSLSGIAAEKITQ